MKPFKDLTGQKFGRLTTLYRLHNIKGKTKWLCVCDCGNLKEVILSDLLLGKSKSCGCLAKELVSSRSTIHGQCGTRLYRIWTKMKERCYTTTNKRYKDYGGRGVAVCAEWKNGFMSFYNWAMANGYDDTLTIDRIDVDGNYEPTNCRWITMKQQSRNKRSNIIFTYNGVTHCLIDWCNILNLKYNTIKMRIKRGWSIERALELEGK